MYYFLCTIKLISKSVYKMLRSLYLFHIALTVVNITVRTPFI
nr:MAG TPA: hypothetical protein [Caudoviricetes sp.]